VRSLLIGCGNSRKKQIRPFGEPDFGELVTLDIDLNCGADIIHDLNEIPYPLQSSYFNEVHAYEVLEHVGRQGDVKFFFDQWNEFHRIMKDGGFFCGSVPKHDSVWAWGDPGHTRVITAETLSFLTEKHYEQIGETASADYRHLLRGYWEAISIQYQHERMFFVMQRK